MSKGLFALFKSAPNCGKSVAALSFPDPFVLDFDRKMPVVGEKHFPGKTFHWKCFEDVFQLSDWMMPFMTGITFPHETLIVDTVTSLTTICLRSVDKTKGKDVPAMMKHLSKGTSGSDEATVEVMGIDYYNAEANFFERYFMDNLKILWAREGNPKHVIVNAHEVTVESAPDLRTKIVTRTKSILTAGRKTAAFIPKAFDEEYVFKLVRPVLGDTLNKAKWTCITSVNQDEDARTCFPFPEVIDFTNRSLYDEMNKHAKWDQKVSIPAEVGNK